MTIICADCGRAIDSPAHLCAPAGSERNVHNPRACDLHLRVDCPMCAAFRTDPLAHWTDGGDLVPGWVDGPEYAADLRDQRRADMR